MNNIYVTYFTLIVVKGMISVKIKRIVAIVLKLLPVVGVMKSVYAAIKQGLILHWMLPVLIGSMEMEAVKSYHCYVKISLHVPLVWAQERISVDGVPIPIRAKDSVSLEIKPVLTMEKCVQFGNLKIALAEILSFAKGTKTVLPVSVIHPINAVGVYPLRNVGMLSNRKNVQSGRLKRAKILAQSFPHVEDAQPI